MDVTTPRLLRVAYASDTDTGSDTAPAATPDADGRGWRLNSVRWSGDPLDAENDAFKGLSAAIEAECGPWNAAARRLVKDYFAWVDASVEAARTELEARLAPYRGLFGYRDFRFSAPRPLPRAHLPISGHAAERVDVAFFPGGGRCVAFVGRGTMSPRRDAERRAALTRAGVAVLDITGSEDFAAILRTGEPFWAGEVLPCGPLLPRVSF
ncbi:hypothetical protein NVS89_06555 [Ancylobacter sp. MQZ15Z-1]|uniref:Uncharacterized protein n=1 Tax=Ancylobacter mangrovi TaxID=2972472 RepID=A0A9X2T6B2_9HYPH|nr:hypothetical protein [Ancylobacter mangrovi]MCS0494753.1 hypothetical protein [Ancylobacter mangrovi]